MVWLMNQLISRYISQIAISWLAILTQLKPVNNLLAG